MLGLSSPAAAGQAIIRLAFLASAAFLLWVLIPLGSLDCGPGDWHHTAPDGTNLRVCGRFVPMAMPGQGSDRPGVLVLRDPAGFIRGLTTLDMARTATDREPEWTADRVAIPLHADLPLPRPLAFPFALLADAGWRIRYALGLAPADTSFR